MGGSGCQRRLEAENICGFSKGLGKFTDSGCMNRFKRELMGALSSNSSNCEEVLSEWLRKVARHLCSPQRHCELKGVGAGASCE